MRQCNNLVFATFLAGATLGLCAQERIIPSTPTPTESRTVRLLVSVTDPDYRPWAGLTQDNFKVYENDREQEIAMFAKTVEPFSIGIILDLSGSMALKLDRARQAILKFIQTVTPQDEYFVVGFNEHPKLIQDFTNSPENIQARLATIHPGGRTALLDALDLGLAKMKEAKYARKALLVVSDGADNHSDVSEGKLREEVRRANVEVYSIGIFSPYAPTPEERIGPQLLNDLSVEAGGRLFRVDEPADMGPVAEEISTQLRYQYGIGYLTSDPTTDGKWRKVKVKIKPSPGMPQLTAHTRTGYYAPTQ
jgi:Ca-activated chloride channel family protein